MTKVVDSIERAYPWLLAAPVILPVVIWGEVIYPYLVPKTLLFYALSLLAAGAFVILVAYGRSFFWARLGKWEAWVPAVLLALAYLASIFGIGFYHSFWSLFVRGDGLLMLSCAVGDFYLLLLYVDRAFFTWFLRAIAVVASFVAVYGIGEWLLGGAGRIGGLLGNAEFFAGYLGIAFFATLVAARDLSLEWRRAAWVGAALQIVAIILSATRGTILALALAGIAALIYFAFRPEAEMAEGKNGVRLGLAPRSASFFAFGISARMFAQVSLGAIIILGVGFFAFRSELAQIPFQPISRLASISATDADTASRLFIWKNMIGQIEAKPLLGVGAEHIDVPFNRFYDPTQIQEEWFDRSHNAFLDYAVQYGLGGLALYLALIASFFTAAWRLKKRGEGRVAGLFALLALAYAAQNFFVFDTVSSFWLVLALLAVLLSASLPDAPRETLALPAWTRYASWLCALVLAALIIPASIYPLMAAYDLAQAYSYQISDPALEINYLSRGEALGTYGDVEYGYEAYSMYTGTQEPSLSGAALDAAYQSAVSVLTINFNRYPDDARTALYLAHVLSLVPADVTPDDTLLSAALQRAISLSPKRSQPWYILVNLSISQANESPAGSALRTAGYAAARDLLTRYIALVPTLAEPHFVLAQLEYAAGDPAAAASEAELGNADYQPDLQTATRAAIYYETANDLPDAEFFLEEIVKLDPGNTSAAADLAKIKSL